ncbi:MAG TPA: metallophosphoesterase [Candidatus Gemmiger avistercoris]|uniref:Metallophosphoesterase n=1 Tax=Candidatus Gemmiger avistercoris TaxID=2838606 RepID=A0A9D2FIK7_9FIRM|nr:metallophosphoesterase [uncultured Subdoligranulum sp.]HIZ61335.1 metallophosphoesterase [Candidatus Gemmiger avistercoris]
MAIFAIGDLHLSLGTDKPMDVFPGWEGYLPKLERSWRALVAPEDTVVLAGDTSWAMNLPDTRADFSFLQGLPGQKWLLKGNHDYWWTTARKMQNFLQENGFDSLHILHNNACVVQGTALCGTRGWPFDDAAAQGEKLMAREAGRLRMSLQAGRAAEQRIAFLHYPPVYPGASAQEIVDVLQECGVTECYYGHLHGRSIRFAVQGEMEGIRYKLISADSLGFCPYKIR